MRESIVAFTRPHRRRPPSDVPVEYENRRRLTYYIPKFKREFDYQVLARILGLHLADVVAEAHVAYIVRYARRTALAQYYALRRFAESTAANLKLATALSHCPSLSTEIGADYWRRSVSAHVSKLQGSSISLTTLAEEIGNLYRGLDELASLGIAASCKRPRMPRNYHASGGHRPGLIEQAGMAPVTQEVVAQLDARIKELNLPVKGREARELLRAVVAQVPADVLHSDVAVTEAIFSLNAKALADIRTAAEDAFIYWRDVWLKGQTLLQDSDGDSIASAVNQASSIPKHLENRHREALFSPDLGDEAMGNFISLIRKTYGPYVPAGVEIGWPPFMKKAYWKLGGRYFFDGCFALHRKGVAAAAILYLVDTGANVSTALSLTTSSEQQTDDPDYVNFVSYKDRAGPEPIVKQLPINSHGVKVTAAQALRDVKAMTQARRDLYRDKLGDSLFVHTFFSRPSVLTNNVLAANFRYILSDRKLPKLWTLSAIRVAVAVEVSGKTDGDMNRVGQKLSHAVGSSTTPIYGLRWAVRQQLHAKIREFQTLLEAALATHASDGPLVLGYSGAVAEVLVNRAIRTGLGFLCKDATTYGGNASGKESTCPVLGKSCASCQVGVFVVDVESLAEVVAVHESLNKKLDEYEENRPKAWIENWLELYAFSSAILQKAKRSRFAHLIPPARRKAQLMLDAGFDVFQVKE